MVSVLTSPGTSNVVISWALRIVEATKKMGITSVVLMALVLLLAKGKAKFRTNDEMKMKCSPGDRAPVEYHNP
jgi:hypothetical protein